MTNGTPGGKGSGVVWPHPSRGCANLGGFSEPGKPATSSVHNKVTKTASLWWTETWMGGYVLGMTKDAGIKELHRRLSAAPSAS
jgi:hypothetical protein